MILRIFFVNQGQKFLIRFFIKNHIKGKISLPLNIDFVS